MGIKILEYDENVREKIFANLNITQESLDRDLKILKEWISKQPHLPQDMSQHSLTQMFLMSKARVEKTKNKIELYCSMRLLFPQYFCQTISTSIEMQKSLKVIAALPLPKQLNCHRIIATTIFNSDIKSINPYAIQAVAFQILDILLEEDFSIGAVFLIDIRNFKLAHMGLVDMTILKSMKIVIEKICSGRLHSIQLICNDQVLGIFLSLLRKIYKQKIIDKVRVHGSLKSLHTEIPKEYLPKELGGYLKPLIEMGDDWHKKLLEYDNHLKKLNAFKMDMSLRPKNLKSDLFDDVQGTFKTLEID